MEKFTIVISDCHLSAGRFYEGHLNPHEDFYFDDEMCDLFEYFSTGQYGTGSDGKPVEVELFINGDFFDFLNVPVAGEFEDAITEHVSLAKCEAIMRGHPKVMAAIKRFAGLPGKKVTYLIGNHDADLFFEKVRERITREWDPNGGYPSERVKLIADRDSVALDGGVEIHHGNQFEAQHVLNFEKPVLDSHVDSPVLNIPWGSFYVLKIINRLKWERDFLDKVRPIRAYIFLGLFVDTLFTIKFGFLSLYYFLKTRFVYSPKRRAALGVTLRIVLQEARMWTNLETEARELLDAKPDVRTVIFGHTHQPMLKVYPDGKQYINTGTWTKMINLDWRSLGQQFRLTFAFVRILSDGESQCDLRHWVGPHNPHRAFHN
jgi:UDP-2,3-diacylglucosamine pyrophosphatase LpxH